MYGWIILPQLFYEDRFLCCLVVTGIFVNMVAHFIYPVADGVAVVVLVLPLVRRMLHFGYSRILNRLVK